MMSAERVAGPSRPIEGIVRNIDTRKPLAGIMVLGEQELLLGEFRNSVTRITDAQGHYRLEGLPRGREGHVVALAPVDFPRAAKRDATLKVPRDEDLPYVWARVEVGNRAGMGTLKLDINLKRGVWVTGRVIEADTGKPVYAISRVRAFVDNPHLDSYPAFRGARMNPHFARRDGAFRFVALPGPGVLAARATEDLYIQGVGVDTFKHKPANGFLTTQPPFDGATSNHHVLAEIDPAPGTVSMNRDLLLQRGRSLTVTVLGMPTANRSPAIRSRGWGTLKWVAGRPLRPRHRPTRSTAWIGAGDGR